MSPTQRQPANQKEQPKLRKLRDTRRAKNCRQDRASKKRLEALKGKRIGRGAVIRDRAGIFKASCADQIHAI